MPKAESILKRAMRGTGNQVFGGADRSWMDAAVEGVQHTGWRAGGFDFAAGPRPPMRMNRPGLSPTPLHTSHPDFPRNSGPMRTHSPGMAEGTPLAAMRKSGTDFGSPYGGPKAAGALAEGVVKFKSAVSMVEGIGIPRGSATPEIADAIAGKMNAHATYGSTMSSLRDAPGEAAGGPWGRSAGPKSSGGPAYSNMGETRTVPGTLKMPSPAGQQQRPPGMKIADLEKQWAGVEHSNNYGMRVNGVRYNSPELEKMNYPVGMMPSSMHDLPEAPGPRARGSTANAGFTEALGGFARGAANVGIGMMAGGVASYATGGEFGQGAIAGGMLGGAAYGATRFGGMALRNAGRAMTAGSASRGFAMQGSAAMAGFNTATNRAGMFAGGAMLGGFVFGGHRQSKKRGFNSNRGNSF